MFFCKPHSFRENPFLDVKRVLTFSKEFGFFSRQKEINYFLAYKKRYQRKPITRNFHAVLEECLGHWYLLNRKPVSHGFKTYSIRAIIVSVACLMLVPISEKYKAAIWSSVHTFTRFYSLDLALCYNTLFGRVVQCTWWSTACKSPTSGNAQSPSKNRGYLSVTVALQE